MKKIALILAGALWLTSQAAQAKELYWTNETEPLTVAEAIGAMNALLAADQMPAQDGQLVKQFASRANIVSIEVIKNDDGATYYYRAARHPLMGGPDKRLFIRVAAVCGDGPAPADGGRCHNQYSAGYEGASH